MNAENRHKQQKSNYDAFRQVDCDIQSQILAAVQPEYLASLEHATLGFARVTSKEMFDHLNDTYGKIKQSDIKANRERLNDDWTIDHPIETLWQILVLCP